jgi:tetratricopeptide (TPR) repeat protein
MTAPISSLSADSAECAGPDDFESAVEALRPGRSLHHPRLREAATFFEAKRFRLATKSLREFLKAHPRDASALLLMAEIAAGQRRNADAETLLSQCLELAPDFTAARYSYANALLRAGKPEEALIELAELLEQEPKNPLFRSLKAVALEAIEDCAASAALWRELIEDYPGRPECWVRYGHSLRAMGLREDCIAAYRKVIELDPSCGDAWWSLADLKTFRFGQDEIEQMESQLAKTDLPAEDRTQLHFALGKACADLKLYQKSFNNYARGNAIHRVGLEHNPDVLTAYIARCKSLFTADFFHERPGSGCSSKEPIFLVGMTRSGSTLIEQILASHSQIEGTRELSDLAALAKLLQADIGPGYPLGLEKVGAPALERLGERYLERARVHRKRGRPFFTDKMGPNFAHLGLLQLILPNARIVDVRRHPLACGFSNFTQLFPEGHNDAYRLTDIGRLYRDYVELMAHFDRVLPEKVHRIFYERLVAQPETEIRRLLDYLGLPFEHACLQFHDTERVVTTVSSEQVRSPIYRDALERWRHFEPWLAPLIQTVGPVLTAYPSVPEDMR